MDIESDRAPWPRRRVRPRSNKGITMVEICAAIIIVGFALVPLLKATERALREARSARDITAATFLAIREMEDVRQKLTCKSSGAGCGAYGWVNMDQAATATATALLSRFYTKVDDTNEQGGNGTRLKSIRITVWRDTNATGGLDPDDESVVLESKVARRYDW